MNNSPVYELTREEEESIAVAHPRIKRMVKEMLKCDIGFKSVEAINTIEKALQMKNDSPLLYLLRGECFYRENELQRSYDDYSSVIRLCPHFSAGYIRRAKILDDLGKLDRSIDDYTYALKLSPEKTKLYFERGCIYEKCTEYKLGIEDFTRSIEEDVDLFESYVHRSNCYKNLDKYYEAIEDLKKALEIKPKDVITLTELGDIYETTKQYDQSIQCYSEAFECNSKDLYIIQNKRGRAYLKKNNLDKADKDIQAALDSNPRESEYIFSHALLFYYKKDYRGCLKEIASAIEYQMNTNYEYYFYQSLCYKSLKNYDEALHSIQLAVRLKPNNLDNLYVLAELYKDLNNYTDAINTLSHIIELEPNDIEYYLTRGLYYQHEHCHRQAIDDFSKCIELDRDNGKLYYYRGLSKYCLDQYNECLSDYDQAHELGFETSEYYNNRGKVYVALQNFSEGLNNISQAIEMEPTRIEYLINRSTCYLNMEIYEKSKEDLDTAITKSKPNDSDLAELNFRKGIILYFQGSFSEALECFTQSLRLITNDYYEHLIYYYIGLCHINNMNYNDGITSLTSAIEALTDTSQYDINRKAPFYLKYYNERAKAKQLIEDFEGAIEDFSLLLKICPDLPSVYFRRAFAYKSLKEYLKSATDFEQAKRLDPENDIYNINYKMIHNVESVLLCDPGEENWYKNPHDLTLLAY